MRDQDMARAIADGDHAVFRTLVDREAPVVLRVCGRVLRGRPEAEDAAQQCFLIAFRSMRTYRGNGSLRAWLCRIAAREALRLARADRTAPLEVAHDRADGRPDPPDELVAAERRATLHRALVDLDDPYREVLMLRFFAELPPREIARVTARPVGTVKTQLRRALERLRDRLGKSWSEAGE